MKLEAGDLAVIPQHRAHQLSAGDSSSNGAAATRAAGDGATTLICGAIEFERLGRNLLLDGLPECIVIGREHSAPHSPLHRLLDLLTLESEDRENACQLVLDKLAGALFAMVLRHYVCTSRPSDGIFAALNDARLNPVLAAVHRNVGRQWQLGQLASLANMSRSSFAQYFKFKLGVPPLEYLTHWRMTHADVQLSDARRSVAQVAELLGYSTEAAFRRAFKRFYGVGPGRIRSEWRKNAQDSRYSLRSSASSASETPSSR